jgi:hypothetical protein
MRHVMLVEKSGFHQIDLLNFDRLTHPPAQSRTRQGQPVSPRRRSLPSLPAGTDSHAERDALSLDAVARADQYQNRDETSRIANGNVLR